MPTYMHAHYIKGEKASQWIERVGKVHIHQLLLYHAGHYWCSVGLQALAKVHLQNAS